MAQKLASKPSSSKIRREAKPKTAPTVATQIITDNYAIYHGNSIRVMAGMPSESVDFFIYSPPFAGDSGGMFNYSSSEEDLSNCSTYQEFLDHYEFVVAETARLLKPGRICAVHCMDTPKDGANVCGYIDFPGDIIRLHEKHGFEYLPRICIWKEPLAVRRRTMAKALAHQTIVEDSTQTNVAASDYLIPFRKKGENKVPVTHPTGFHRYVGANKVPADRLAYKGWTGDQTKNIYSHWIWRQYASAIWNDIRIDRVLPFDIARDPQDEKHPHPLQRDVIERAIVMWTNPDETVGTPFMGVGSEVHEAIITGRKAFGIELKGSYFRQAAKNLENPKYDADEEEPNLFPESPEA